MEKRFQGGTNLLYVPLSPNAVKGFGVDETIETRGEMALRVQFQSCPCPENQRLKECKVKGCFDGFIRTFQDYKEIVNEPIPENGILGNKIYPRFAPLKSVISASLLFDDNVIPLVIENVEDDYFQVNKQLEYYRSVNVTYRVKTVEERIGQIEILSPSKKIDLGFYNKEIPEIILSVNETFIDGKPIECLGNTFNALNFQSNIVGKLNYKIKTYVPFKLAYRESSLTDSKTDKASLKLDSGDIEVTISQSEKVAEGDIITLVGMYFNTSQYVAWKEGVNYDYLSFAPLKEIINCFTKKDNQIIELFEGKDFVVMDFERILWLREKPRDGYSIRYSYHPSYRLQKASGGANENKNTPRNYVGKLISNYRSF